MVMKSCKREEEKHEDPFVLRNVDINRKNYVKLLEGIFEKKISLLNLLASEGC